VQDETGVEQADGPLPLTTGHITIQIQSLTKRGPSLLIPALDPERDGLIIFSFCGPALLLALSCHPHISLTVNSYIAKSLQVFRMSAQIL